MDEYFDGGRGGKGGEQDGGGNRAAVGTFPANPLFLRAALRFTLKRAEEGAIQTGIKLADSGSSKPLTSQFLPLQHIHPPSKPKHLSSVPEN